MTSSKGNRKYSSVLGIRIASALAFLTVALWMLFGNLACVWQEINTFVIRFNPAHFYVDAPGKAGTVLAELIWTSEGNHQLEALNWEVDPGLPRILASASCSPRTESEFTNISLQCVDDPALFEPSGLWVASKESAYLVGVKARFVDPVWKSLSEGQEAVIARKAYLPIRSGMPKIVVREGGWGTGEAAGDMLFYLTVDNHLDGWTYSYSTEARRLSWDDQLSISISGNHAVSPGNSLGQLDYEYLGYCKKASVRFRLVCRSPTQSETRELKNFPYNFSRASAP